jgi:hypothetical protein
MTATIETVPMTGEAELQAAQSALQGLYAAMRTPGLEEFDKLRAESSRDREFASAIIADANKAREDARALKAENKALRGNAENRALVTLAEELQRSEGERRRLERDLEELREVNAHLQSTKEWSPLFQGSGVVDRGGFYVYELLDRHGGVVYVGQSSALMTRMNGHRDKTWTHVRFAQFHTAREMDDREGSMIHAMHPKYNRYCPVCRSVINQDAPESEAA